MDSRDGSWQNLVTVLGCLKVTQTLPDINSATSINLNFLIGIKHNLIDQLYLLKELRDGLIDAFFDIIILENHAGNGNCLLSNVFEMIGGS